MASNHGEQIVEVVRHAARRAADGLHFLRLAKFLPEQFGLRDVCNQRNDLVWLLPAWAEDESGADPHPDRAAILAQIAFFVYGASTTVL